MELLAVVAVIVFICIFVLAMWANTGDSLGTPPRRTLSPGEFVVPRPPVGASGSSAGAPRNLSPSITARNTKLPRSIEDSIVKELGYDPRPGLSGRNLLDYYLIAPGKMSLGVTGKCPCCGARETMQLHGTKVCSYCRTERG